VLLLAVVPQPLAVIRHQEDRRLLVETEVAQPSQQLAHHPVGGGDLAVVGRLVARGERLRRFVGQVGLEQVEEEEERAPGHRSQPGEGGRQGLGATARNAAQRHPGARGNAVVVEVEAGAETTVLPQDRGRQEAFRRGQVIALVVSHTVHGRQAAGQHGDVRRQSQRRVAVGPLEEQRVAPQRVDGGCLHTLVAISGQPVGA
jgi:hypothetical protein